MADLLTAWISNSHCPTVLQIYNLMITKPCWAEFQNQQDRSGDIYFIITFISFFAKWEHQHQRYS